MVAGNKTTGLSQPIAMGTSTFNEINKRGVMFKLICLTNSSKRDFSSSFGATVPCLGSLLTVDISINNLLANKVIVANHKTER